MALGVWRSELRFHVIVNDAATESNYRVKAPFPLKQINVLLDRRSNFARCHAQKKGQLDKLADVWHVMAMQLGTAGVLRFAHTPDGLFTFDALKLTFRNEPALTTHI